MPLIRTKRVGDNAGGRDGCQIQSPWTSGIYYLSVEHGTLFLRDYDGRELARDPDPVTLVPSGTISACFASRRGICVTISGFPANTGQSGMDTYLLTVAEDL